MGFNKRNILLVIFEQQGKHVEGSENYARGSLSSIKSTAEDKYTEVGNNIAMTNYDRDNDEESDSNEKKSKSR